ncbi:DnaJ subfamily C member 8-like [Homarus americanus]|uniref:DnaJ subfamily C member 8-like n=1 Tax=Homarus americanus TaxID=6706 RepID=A0A8J5K4I2_HOMAM|nr:DnaJ subfamily C member 8-like [Homarus americanus]
MQYINIIILLLLIHGCPYTDAPLQGICKQAAMASPMFKPIGSNSGGASGEGENKFDVFYKDSLCESHKSRCLNSWLEHLSAKLPCISMGAESGEVEGTGSGVAGSCSVDAAEVDETGSVDAAEALRIFHNRGCRRGHRIPRRIPIIMSSKHKRVKPVPARQCASYEVPRLWYSLPSLLLSNVTSLCNKVEELKETEKRDSVLTSKQQIDRLLRPGASYANLNPFEVLQVDPRTPIDDIKKKFRRMSILVHPDKNQDDSERAQKAFDELTKAWRCLENESTRQKCLDIVEEAEAIVAKRIEERKKQLKREGKDARVDEDDPEKLKRAVYVQTMKLFADMERKRRQQETRDQEERKRKRDLEIEEEEQKKAEKEWQKNFEESRVNRVNSWKDFQKGKSAKKFKGFKPPKHKAEARD